MNTHRLFVALFVVVLIAVFALTLPEAGTQADGAAEWEYLLVTVMIVDNAHLVMTANGEREVVNGTLADAFNQLGADGWEYHSPLGDYLLFRQPR